MNFLSNQIDLSGCEQVLKDEKIMKLLVGRIRIAGNIPQLVIDVGIHSKAERFKKAIMTSYKDTVSDLKNNLVTALELKKNDDQKSK